MNNCRVRFSGLTIENIKNVEYGKFTMPSMRQKNKGSLDEYEADIAGIYGQNGSGKTTVIDTLYLIKSLLSGEKLNMQWGSYIRMDSPTACFEAEFLVYSKEAQFQVFYEVELVREDGGFTIGKETISYRKRIDEKHSRKRIAISFNIEEQGIPEPKKRLEELAGRDKERKEQIKRTVLHAFQNRASAIFSLESRILLTETYHEEYEDVAFLIQTLHQYAMVNLFVIQNIHSGKISADFILPMVFRAEDARETLQGSFFVNLRNTTLLEKTHCQLLKQVLVQVNLVIGAIIPGMFIALKEMGTVEEKAGEVKQKIELISCRGDIEIPVRQESEGIIKIISILSALIQVYNNPYLCLAVDELDAGVYEYLLGEILDLFYRGGKGQLIFTSHNLRPLEMLPRQCIVFSTANPKNRYIRMQMLKRQRNLRDAYLRCITLGGQEECVYQETDSIKIARAFRNAGRILNHDS